MDRLKLSLRGALLAAPFVLWGGYALGRDDGRYANSPLKPWFDSLKSGKGGVVLALMGEDAPPF